MMKEKMVMSVGEHCFQVVLPLGCWKPAVREKSVTKRLLKRYQTLIDAAAAGAAITVMFLIGSWAFLAQLAEYGG